MKQDLIYTHTYKQTFHMTTGLKSHLEILSKDRQTLSDLLYTVSQNNPFLEYTPSQDIQQYLEAGISDKPSLKNELYLQLHTTKQKHNETIADYIIESLDSHGFFNYDLDIVLNDLKCTKEEFTDTLNLIQTFEPLGVAAKNSVDSLMIQLKEKEYIIAYTILKDYSKELEEKDFYTISESLDIPYESVFDELAHMQECNPFPCSEYATESTTNLALPEFTIEIIEDQLKIIPKEMGNLSLHCEEVKLSKEAKKYLNEAKFYIDSLNRRNKTILLLANILITHQKNYFLFQDDLRECTLKEIAQESGYSISTVSRTLSDKYYEFNNQIYPVKDLFVSKTHNGSSKDSIQKAIQLLIMVEDKENPLQDEQIVKELEDMELYASRRTISKYRKELNIPNSKQRKKAGY
ncbi:LacI family DNA-binding transcriptional regulator [Eubacterium sp. AF22-8LB]|uniref:RNA polymerase factor sigma-54 n=1 Tax=Eubacterium sp. AF22-8LB TaxID=2292232 RepID=UPI000E4A0ABF|nr:LacI family DNA-binding transcriptional regulator [Eubacterium sp. AF22-8LB]RGS30106.1 LacI family DNA-binding transcriptional regulator [Eubacterium sp. AF22-8LB]